MGDVDNGVGLACVVEGGMLKIYVPSSQLDCKPKTSQKISLIILKSGWGDGEDL